MTRYAMIMLLVLVPCLAAATTPTVTNVTGTISTGQTLTITGTHMMDEDNTNWLATSMGAGSPNYKTGTAYGFEGDLLSDKWWNSGYCGGPCTTTDNGYTQTDVKLAGSYALLYHNSGVATSGGGIDGNYITIGQSVNDVWTRGYIRIDNNSGNWPNTAFKMFEFSGDGGKGLYVQPESGSPPDKLIDAYDDTNQARGYFPGGAIQYGRWYCIEIHSNFSAGLATVFIDGAQLFTETSTARLQFSVNSLGFGLVNYFDTTAQFEIREYWDNLAQSTTQLYPSSAIRISGDNGSTWTYQPPTGLSDTSVSVTAVLPTLSASHYLLQVTNNRQQSSTTYTLGDAGDSTAPSTTITQSSPQAISSDTLSISGTASDAVGVTGCKWRIGSAPDATHGTALTGTTSWSGTATGFSSGANTLHVACYDAAGNYGDASITADYTPPVPSYRFTATGVTLRGVQ